jgi:hypothetical protein
MQARYLNLILVFIFWSYISITEVKCQNFMTEPLIEIPGDNLEFDIISEGSILNSKGYICWINKINSIYTVYLKQISPFFSEDIIISSDSKLKSNPQLAFNRYDQGVKIVWQTKNQNLWQVKLRNYFSTELIDSVLILDSLKSNPEISLSLHRIAWIENENLFYKEFYPNLSHIILIDSLFCSSPKLFKYDFHDNFKILYVKSYNDSSKVYLAEYNNQIGEIRYFSLSNSLFNENPRFGMSDNEYSFQSFEDGVWKSVYSKMSDQLLKTNNKDCNYKNPLVFTYDVPTGQIYNNTPFFLAFDTDSISENNEVYIKPFYFGQTYDLINISKSLGNDSKPEVLYLSNSDTIYVSIFWKHTQNERTDIWFAKSIFQPIISSVNSDDIFFNDFRLHQNYPNPFNPITKIKFELPQVRNENFQSVRLTVYDILGKKMTTLIHENRNPGVYEIEWNAIGETSGLYLYKLEAGDFVQIRKMLLIK